MSVKLFINAEDYVKYISKPSDHPLNSFFWGGLVNKNVIGQMKYEFKGKIINEILLLKSKMCSLISVDNEEVKKAIGVNKK